MYVKVLRLDGSERLYECYRYIRLQHDPEIEGETMVETLDLEGADGGVRIQTNNSRVYVMNDRGDTIGGWNNTADL